MMKADEQDGRRDSEAPVTIEGDGEMDFEASHDVYSSTRQLIEQAAERDKAWRKNDPESYKRWGARNDKQ